MSWLARSFANSLRLDDDDDRDDDDNEEIDIVPDPPHDPSTTSSRDGEPHYLQHHKQQQPLQPQERENEVESEDEAQERGVKEDLDEIKQTLTRQFWDMASFLAPPPTNSHSAFLSGHHTTAAFHWNQSEPSDQCVCGDEEELELQDDASISWIRRDISDIEGRFGREAPGISGADPNSFSFGSEPVGKDESESGMEEFDLKRAVGITEEVLAFARNIAMHPETWLDFPIDEEDDTDDFDMSDAQKEHALAIERLLPRLAALRIELCPCHMSKSYFWKVYFVLLHSRLNKQDMEILSTPQVMAARAIWMQELHKQTKPEPELFGRSSSYLRDSIEHGDFSPNLPDDAYSDEPTLSMMADNEIEKHMVESSQTSYIDKSVIEEKPIIKTENKDPTSCRSFKIILQDYEDDEDEWPEEDCDFGGYGGSTISVMNEEDISFSDLEDDDYDIKPVKSKMNSNMV